MQKTNAMRILDAAKIPYRLLAYEVNEDDLSGVHASEMLGFPAERMFKTLVAKGDKTGFLVFCIPVAEELDLKVAASVTGNKRVELIPVKDLLATTGYLRGGCSPVGMKKVFPTFADASALNFEEITVSAGQRGKMLCLSRASLFSFLNIKTDFLTVKSQK